MLKDKITLNIAEAVKKVLNTEGRIDDLRDNKRVRDDTDWYHDKPEKKEKKKESSGVKTHVGKYGKSNFKSMSEDSEQINELSKNTLSNYIKKASSSSHSNSVSNLSSRAAYDHSKDLNGDAGEKDDMKSYKRSKKIALAVDKLTKEDTGFSNNLEIFSKQGLK